MEKVIHAVEKIFHTVEVPDFRWSATVGHGSKPENAAIQGLTLSALASLAPLAPFALNGCLISAVSGGGVDAFAPPPPCAHVPYAV
jgi:hypothetical protein